VFKSVLIVCVGNICRSPMAEYLLKANVEQRSPGIDVASAGLGALVGHGADKHALSLMDERGIDMHLHRARQLTVEMINVYELILVMENGHVRAINDMAPQSRGRVHLLGKWNGNEEITDPYRQSRAHFEAALSAIERGVTSWIKYF